MQPHPLNPINLPDLIENQQVWRGGAPAAVRAVVPTGFGMLDAELPGGGWPAGGLAEVFCGCEGIGELQVVLPALAALTASGKRVAWLAPPHLPYAPALRAAGVQLDQLTVIRAPGRRDALWAAEQALRSGAFHALLAWLPGPGYAELRRLAVAAQASPGFALVFRPLEAMGESSPAMLQLAIDTPETSQAADAPLALRILKRRGAPLARLVPLSIERPVRVVARPPFPAAAPASDRARACVA